MRRPEDAHLDPQKIPDDEFSFKDVGDVLRSIRPEDGSGPTAPAGKPAIGLVVDNR